MLNQARVIDSTYTHLLSGRPYLAVVLSLFARKVMYCSIAYLRTLHMNVPWLELTVEQRQRNQN